VDAWTDGRARAEESLWLTIQYHERFYGYFHLPIALIIYCANQ
jgi:hypothetical protein